MAVPLFGQALGLPYASGCNMNFSGSMNGSCNFTAVPAGKQLVINEFDANGKVEPLNHPWALFLNNTATQQSYFPYTYSITFDRFDYLATHVATYVYVGAGATPQCKAQLPAASEGSYYCDINGVLQPSQSDDQGVTLRESKPASDR